MKIRLLLVDHEFHPIDRRFNVETSDSDEISDLKEKVKKEGPDILTRYNINPISLTVWQTQGEYVLNRSTTHLQGEILEKIKNKVNDEDIIRILEEEVEVDALQLPDGEILIVRLPGMSHIPLAYCCHLMC